MFGQSLLTQHQHIQGRRSSGREGSSNGVEGNGNFSKTRKKRYKLCLFLLSSMLPSKI